MSLREAFRHAAGYAKKLGTGEALARVGLSFKGTAHRGMDDGATLPGFCRTSWDAFLSACLIGGRNARTP